MLQLTKPVVEYMDNDLWDAMTTSDAITHVMERILKLIYKAVYSGVPEEKRQDAALYVSNQFGGIMNDAKQWMQEEQYDAICHYAARVIQAVSEGGVTLTELISADIRIRHTWNTQYTNAGLELVERGAFNPLSRR